VSLRGDTAFPPEYHSVHWYVSDFEREREREELHPGVLQIDPAWTSAVSKLERLLAGCPRQFRRFNFCEAPQVESSRMIEQERERERQRERGRNDLRRRSRLEKLAGRRFAGFAAAIYLGEIPIDG